MIFPEGFVWGAATAALQIEGVHGRGRSIWDDFCDAHPERIHQAATPALACDHVRRWREDVDWISTLGHNGYRMSICWPRVLPDGHGRPSTEGLDFYDRLFDALLEKGIAPNVTLYHWDLPSALRSWASPTTVDRFVEYADLCFRRFGDRVRLWATLNEPGWSILNGYVTGLHPPALHDYPMALQAAHNMLTAHDRVTRLYHGMNLRGGIGIALNLSAVRPATGSAEDRRAADIADGMLNRWFIDPVLRGRYPTDVVDLYRGCGFSIDDAGFGGDVDWVGVNYYYPHHAAADAERTAFHLNTSGDAEDACLFSIEGLFRFVQNRAGRYTAWNWEIDPSGLESLLLRARDLRPDVALYVTENGIGLDDRPSAGEIDDSARIGFVREHLEAIHRAIEAGVDVRGYYMWSLMDNFSWINGYKKRYGFLHVDRATLERTPKRSAWWYREVASANGLVGA